MSPCAHARAGEVLFSQGDAGDAVYVIERGEIEISVHSLDGRKLALDIQRDGEVFGEIALFGGDRTATATAPPTRAPPHPPRRRAGGAAPPARARARIHRHPLRAAARAQRKLEERSFLPVPVRLASRLLYLDGKLGGAAAVAVSQADLADFVGATREAVAKTLAVWRGRNWVALSRGAIHILERNEIEAVAATFRE